MKFKKVIGVIILIAVLLGVGGYTFKNVLFPYKYQEYVDKYSEKYGVDPLLVLSIMKTESGFDERAISNKGAKGLMQIMDATAEWIAEQTGRENFEVDMIYDEEINIEFGCWYINNLIQQFGDKNLAIASYNAGSGNVTKWLDNKEYSADGENLTYIPFEETKKYVDKVNTSYNVYKWLYE